MSRKKVFLIMTIISFMLIGCSWGHNADLSISESGFLPNLDSPVTVKQVKTGAQVEYWINDEQYVELKESSPDTGFIEHYGWEVDLSCFELYAETKNGERLYRSPNDGNVDLLVLEKNKNGEKIVKMIARKASILHDWTRFANDFFDVALVDRMITKSEYIQPILNAHFHGTKDGFILNQTTDDLLIQNRTADVSLEVKDIPGLWYRFCVIGDENITVYSRTDVGFLNLNKPFLYCYGVVLQEMPDHISTIISEIKESKEVEQESGYWFNNMLVYGGALTYEDGLLIPLKEYLNLLPIMSEWETDEIGWIFKNEQDAYDLSKATCFKIDLKNQEIQEKETGFSFKLNDGNNTYSLNEKDGIWMIDIQSFISILDCLRYNYYMSIDTEQNSFQLFLKPGEYDYRKWDLRSFEKGTFGGTNKWPSGILY